MDKAECYGHTDLMFNQTLSNRIHDERWARPGLALCARCEVRSECLAWALGEDPDPAYMGIAGGKTYAQRMRMRALTPPRRRAVKW
jgi:hypothetical protein